MGDIAIRADRLGKQYRIAELRAPYGLLSERITESFAQPLRRAADFLAGGKRGPEHHGRGSRSKPFWALRDVAFEIKQGEVVGVIGRNGAGKSTLLKILARITKPTEGRVDLYGRVGSLLEVGTGFHPELTGRENVFLNGAILGMRRAEIARKFDEIVAFAEVEPFIDTPVKRYSSGMTVRLAFAVAAHLDPEILLIDEVLAVGDAAFQKKCLGKLGDVARAGRTVIFVSHDLTAVQILCQRALRLVRGHAQGAGDVADEIKSYLAESKGLIQSDLDRPVSLSEHMRLMRFGFTPNPAESRSPAAFHLAIECSVAARIDRITVLIQDALNRRVGTIDFRQSDAPYRTNGRDLLKMTAQLVALPLIEGEYRVGLWIQGDDGERVIDDLIALDVIGKVDRDIVPDAATNRGIVAFDYAIQLADG